MQRLGMIAAGYVALVLILVVAAQYTVRSTARLYADVNPSGVPTHVMIYIDFPLPFGLGGGPHPGTVKLVDNNGHVLDEDHIGDVLSVSNIQFYSKANRATFTYRKGGREVLITLDADTGSQ